MTDENLPVVVSTPKQNVQDDFELARNSLRDLIEKANATLDGILKLAESAEHPRIYEVAGQLIKEVGEATERLMRLHKDHQEVTGEGAEQGDVNIEKAIFVGSTEDLQRLIRDQKQKEAITVEAIEVQNDSSAK